MFVRGKVDSLFGELLLNFIAFAEHKYAYT